MGATYINISASIKKLLIPVVRFVQLIAGRLDHFAQSFGSITIDCLRQEFRKQAILTAGGRRRRGGGVWFVRLVCFFGLCGRRTFDGKDLDDLGEAFVLDQMLQHIYDSESER